ncbi:MAG: hypothetical protein Q7R98_00610 [Candidatus Jorgensenbacteria bacterium]|nr:hypothetical protein [Candidatus Jorgensenbacteria bacterium]
MGDVILQKKIAIDARETVGEVSERLRKEEYSRIVLSLPSKSRIGSVQDFRELKKATEENGKEISIESSSKRILEFARDAGMQAFNDSDARGRIVSDVISRDALRGAGRKGKFNIPEFLRRPRDGRENAIDGQAGAPRGTRKKMSRRTTSAIVMSCVAIVAVLAFLYFELPRAVVTVTLKKTVVPFNEVVIISSKAIAPSVLKDGSLIIPGELLTASRNLERTFPASGSERVDVKATGKLVVTNAYSSDAQRIVATTRFVSPDGKIFRLDKPAVIQGAKVIGGKIQPSTTEVSVTADKPGEEYNIAPATDWKIPGFMGTPKYTAFTAESLAKMTGGISGERPAPTEKDIEAAKQVVASALQEATAGEIAVLLAPKFVGLPGAQKFTMTNTDISRPADDPKKFSLFGEAETRKLVFLGETLQDKLVEYVRPASGDSLEVNNFTITYGEPRVDFIGGTETLAVSGSVIFQERIDKKQVVREILGMKEEALKHYIFALPGLEKATISLWPFWVTEVPGNTGKVTVMFQ